MHDPESDPWQLRAALALTGCTCDVRPLEAGDEAALVAFGRTHLSDLSRKLFAPYNWDSPKLAEEFAASIAASLARRDLHLVALDATSEPPRIVGHAFLWSVGDDVPELGVAVADELHGRGLGQALIRLLDGAARHLNRAAIELTTMQDNARAFATYRRYGFEDLGIIRNPLGVDVTAAFAGTATPTGFADEHHMCLVLDEGRRQQTLAQLKQKQLTATKLFGGLGCEPSGGEPW